MKQTLFFSRSFFTIATFMLAYTSQMAIADNTLFSSDSCAAIDEKIMKLDRFTTMVNNTSAFHLEEKASALPVPGITVSTNKKKMLRDAKKKYAEYAAERQKHDCKTPMAARTQAADKKTVLSKPAISTDKMAVANNSLFSSDSCAAIDEKIMKLDRFTTMVNNTSAFHLEEKASALPVPGITVSTNKKKMLRDAKKKYAEYAAERQKHDCKTPVAARTQAADKKRVVSKPAISVGTSAYVEKKVIKRDNPAPKIHNTSAVNKKEKNSVYKVERQKHVPKAPVATQKVDNKRVAKRPAISSNRSEECASIAKKIMELDKFTTMVNNTSAFHWEEKATALLVPGITVSTNKKKMLRNAAKKDVELLKEQQKYGCKTANK